jgi:SPP1 gp7 family putative phage head morphogenesis protein
LGLLDILKFRGKKERPPVAEVHGQPVKVVEVGSSGTEIYAGYLSEDYLAELRGRRWADTIDQMRRSDANVKMTLNALKLPLKSSKWIIQTTEASEAAEMQKKIIENALFRDTGRSFKKVIGEVLTTLDFGYSLFELTFRAKLDDPELGPYNTLKSIAFRGQRTIEKWNVANDGELICVTQIADGDTGRMVDLDSRFLLHFALEQEGDNYEGISILRPMYGSWLRKNHFLKLMAAGIEKYAIPIPILEVPTGRESSEEYSHAIAALEAYTSNQSNYLTVPQGWKLTIQPTTFESEKIRSTINFENQEMVNSILASFLLLGQNRAGGSYALGDTLSDFFGQTLISVADHISEQFKSKVFEPLIKMNFGNVPVLVELKCENLAEKADKAYAETIKVLVDGGVIESDDKLEEYVREKYRLPKKDETSTRQAPAQASFGAPKMFAEEKKSPVKKQREASVLIRSSAKELKDIFKRHLSILGTDLINKTIKEMQALPESKQAKAAVNVDVASTDPYSERMLLALTLTYVESQDQIYDLLKSGAKKLSEFRLAQDRQTKIRSKVRQVEALDAKIENSLLAYMANPSDRALAMEIKSLERELGELSKETRGLIEQENDLTFTSRQKLQAKAQSILDVQVSDLRKATVLQFGSSFPSTDDDEVLRKDMTDSVRKTINGPMTTTGPDILGSQVVNEGRLDAAQEIQEEGLDEVESYTFVAVDDDRTTDICLELNGRTFAANDPDVDKYSPPLHHNCRSYLAANLRSFKKNPEVTSEKLTLSKDAQKAITLSEDHRNDLLGQGSLKKEK